MSDNQEFYVDFNLDDISLCSTDDISLSSTDDSSLSSSDNCSCDKNNTNYCFSCDKEYCHCVVVGTCYECDKTYCSHCERHGVMTFCPVCEEDYCCRDFTEYEICVECAKEIERHGVMEL